MNTLLNWLPLISLVMLLLFVVYIAWSKAKIKFLIEENEELVDTFSISKLALVREHEVKVKQWLEKIESLTRESEEAKRKFAFAYYLLMNLNKNWYKALKIYDPEQSNPTLRLSVDKETNTYDVKTYIGSTDLNDKTDFLVSIGAFVVGGGGTREPVTVRLSRLLNRLAGGHIMELPSEAQSVKLTKELV